MGSRECRISYQLRLGFAYDAASLQKVDGFEQNAVRTSFVLCMQLLGYNDLREGKLVGE